MSLNTLGPDASQGGYVSGNTYVQKDVFYEVPISAQGNGGGNCPKPVYQQSCPTPNKPNLNACGYKGPVYVKQDGCDGTVLMKNEKGEVFVAQQPVGAGAGVVAAQSVHHAGGWGWSWLGALILWFIVFTVFFWLIFYSLKPSMVINKTTGEIDTAKVLLAAVILAIVLVIIIWIIKALVMRHRGV